MLTIFGRKKKEGEDNKSSQAAAPSSSPQQTAYGPAAGNPPVQSNEASSDQSEQESPFARIFQSISKDYQSQVASRPETVSKSVSATPEWVQPRAIPPSKPMIITPQGSRASKEETVWETNKSEIIDKAEGEGESAVEAPRPVPAPMRKEGASLSQALSNQQSSPPRSLPTPTFQQPQLSASQNTAVTPQRPSFPGPGPIGASKQPASPSEESESVTVHPPSGSKKSKEEEKRPADSATVSQPGVRTESSSLITLDESPVEDFSGLLGLSKLLAETDSALALGREREKELSVEKQTPARSEPKKERMPEKREKKEEKPQPVEEKKPATGKGRDFQYVFELAHGGLDSPGLVAIDGTAGSGKTTICLGLVDRYLKQNSPCIFVSYGQAPARVREGLKTLGCDAAAFESSYRFMIVDAYSAQSGGFSLELYSLVEPFEFSKLEESVIGNCGMFIGENVRVFIDSVDGVAGKVGWKEFGKLLEALAGRLKSMNVTLIVSCDLSSVSKDTRSSIEDASECVLEVEAENGGKEHSLRVARSKGEKLRGKAEEYELAAGKGLVFV